MPRAPRAMPCTPWYLINDTVCFGTFAEHHHLAARRPQLARVQPGWPAIRAARFHLPGAPVLLSPRAGRLLHAVANLAGVQRRVGAQQSKLNQAENKLDKSKVLGTKLK